MVILASSALSLKNNRTIPTQEGLQRLRNTKIELGPKVQKKYLNLFMLKLKRSGYNQKFRKEILKSILKAYKIMVKEDKNGTKPLYRSRDWNSEERNIQKASRKLNWWNNARSKIQYKTVLFVTPTPRGVVMKEVQQREEELNRNSDERILVVEKGGLKIKDILCSKNPFKKSKCHQKTCPLCAESEFVQGSSEEIKVPCSTNNVGYRWSCVNCEEKMTAKVYEGETSRSARLRGAEHLKQLQNKSENSVLYKHKMAAPA